MELRLALLFSIGDVGSERNDREDNLRRKLLPKDSVFFMLLVCGGVLARLVGIGVSTAL